MDGLIQMDKLTMPARTAGTLARYFISHIPPGGFIEAVLLGDLFLAVSRADLENRKYLIDIVVAIANYLPVSVTRKGYYAWLDNDDENWHKQAIEHHGKRWEPYLNM